VVKRGRAALAWRSGGYSLFSRRSDVPVHSPEESRVTKQGMVDLVARHLKTSKAKAADVVDLFFSTSGLIAAELRKGGKVQISGFGHFEVRRRAPRQVRNPRTGKAMATKASLSPVFRAGKGLKDLLNRKR